MNHCGNVVVSCLVMEAYGRGGGKFLRNVTYGFVVVLLVCFIEDEFDLDEWYEAEERRNGEPTPAKTDSES